MLSTLDEPSGRWRGWYGAGRVLLWGLVVAGVIATGAFVQPELPLPSHEWKLGLITLIGFGAMLPAVAVITRVDVAAGGLRSQFASDEKRPEALREPSERGRRRKGGNDTKGAAEGALVGFLRLRDLLDNALLILGTVVAAAILGAGALRNAVNAPKGPSSTDYPFDSYCSTGCSSPRCSRSSPYRPTYASSRSGGTWSTSLRRPEILRLRPGRLPTRSVSRSRRGSGWTAA